MTGAEAQPKPKVDRSSCPDTVRQDEVAVHAPTTFPPQDVTSEHDASWLPVLLLDLAFVAEPDAVPEEEECDPKPEADPSVDAPGDEPLDAEHAATTAVKSQGT